MRSYGVVLGGLLLAACGAPETSPADTGTDTLSTGVSYEEFKAATYQEPDTGLYIVDGDVPIVDEAALRQFYEENVRPGALLILTRSGVDAAWSGTQALNLTYCVSTAAFGSNYDKVVEAMNRAAVAWENVAHVSFIHDSGQDSNCTASNNTVLFDVRLAPTSATYGARAFFPGDARSSREILIHANSLASNIPMPSLAGMLTHELGHVLGFRHEHIRVAQTDTRCIESNDWRDLTPYDSGSVMHYNICNGSTNPGAQRITGWDAHGAAAKYGRGPQAVSGDFDGNGYEDLLIYRPGSNQAWVAWSDGFGGWQRSTSIFGAGFDFWSAADRVVVLDFNHDGRKDFFFYRPGGGPAYAVRSNADRTFTTTMASFSFAGFDFGEAQDRAVAFDYDNDNNDDLFFYRPGNGVAWVAHSNGDGTFSNTFASFAGIGTFDLSNVRDQVVVLDYNNDGRDDLFFYRPGGGVANLVQSAPAGFSSILNTGNIAGFDFSDVRDRVLAIEQDGDNLDDLFLYRPGKAVASIGRGNGWGGFTTALQSTNGIGGYDLWDFRDQARVLDYDADGKDDLFLFRPGSQAAYVLKSYGNGSFGAVYGALGFAPPYPFDFTKHQDQAVIFDYNNDGRDDFYLFRNDTQRVVASLSNGQFASFYPDPALNPY